MSTIKVIGLIVFLIVLILFVHLKITKETKMQNAHEPLPHRLNDQEVAEYRAAIERLEQARAEIFGLHYKAATILKLNPSEIHIEEDGRIFRV
jgi:hypothetical protein